MKGMNPALLNLLEVFNSIGHGLDWLWRLGVEDVFCIDSSSSGAGSSQCCWAEERSSPRILMSLGTQGLGPLPLHLGKERTKAGV